MRLFFTRIFFLVGFCGFTGQCALAAFASSGKWELLLTAAKKEGEVVIYTLPCPSIDYLGQHDYEFYTRYREQVIEQVNDLLGR